MYNRRGYNYYHYPRFNPPHYNNYYYRPYYEQNDYYYDDEYYDDYDEPEEDELYFPKQKELIFDNQISFTKTIDDLIEEFPSEYINDNFLNILMVAEKPSIAKKLTEILTPKSKKFENKSKEMGWAYYTFEGFFKNIKAKFTVTSVKGHIYESQFLRKHCKWDNILPGDLYEVKTIKEIIKDNKKSKNEIDIIDFLKKAAENKDILMLWLDCDSEGENICYEVIYNVLQYMNQKDYQQIYRALFSSLAEEKIKEAFNNIENYPDNNLSESVDAREIIDLKVGVSFSRLLTQEVLPIIKNLLQKKTDIISYGPCQTPTLWFCVKRQREVESNKTKPYYKIFIKVLVNGNEYKIYFDEEYSSESQVIKLKNKLKGEYLKVISSKAEHNTIEPPVGLNTANLLKLASIQLKFSPNYTMSIAQKLYMNGDISYPRTESTQYVSDNEIKRNLQKLSSIDEEDDDYLLDEEEEDDDYFYEENENANEEENEEEEDYCYSEDAHQILENFVTAPKKGKDMGDHPPITPMRLRTKNDYKKKEDWFLYESILLNYFASLSPAILFDKTKNIFEIGNEIFNATVRIVRNDFSCLDYQPFIHDDFIYQSDELKNDEKYVINEIGYEEKKRDNYITESELIEEMEKNRIGTDASIPQHIENIVKRGYVNLNKKDRTLIPTTLGKTLIEALEKVDNGIIKPENRATIEGFVNQVSHGEESYENALDQALEFYHEKFCNVSGNIETIVNVFKKNYGLSKKK